MCKFREDAGSVLINSPESMLPTILSRCQQLAFRVLPVDVITEALTSMQLGDDETRPIIARLANGSLSRAVGLIEDDRLALRKETVELMRAAFRSPTRGDRMKPAFARALPVPVSMICRQVRPRGPHHRGGLRSSLIS